MVGNNPKQSTAEEERLLTSDGQRSDERERDEFGHGPQSPVGNSQHDDRKASTFVQIDPPSFTTGAPSASTDFSNLYPPPATTEKMITQWVDAQVAYSETWPSRQRVIYTILTIYCLIPEIASLATQGGWVWSTFCLWIATSLVFLWGHRGAKKGRAAALESVNLVAERMRSLMYAERSRDIQILEFLEDEDISAPPFSPVPPSILLFANDHMCRWVAQVGLGLSFLPYCGVFSYELGRIVVNHHIENGVLVGFSLGLLLEFFLIIPLLVYADRDHCGALDNDRAKLQWAWHKKHFHWWGAKAVKDVLQPDAISALEKATASPFRFSARSSFICRHAPPPNSTPAADISTLSMDVLLQELQRRMEDGNVVAELQRRMNEGDVARRAYLALSGTNSNPPSYV
ncbi:hypothetical protein IAR50_006607 [Cryptococcus sp. DSM 104548]